MCCDWRKPFYVRLTFNAMEGSYRLNRLRLVAVEPILSGIACPGRLD